MMQILAIFYALFTTSSFDGMATIILILHIIQYTGFIAAQLTNSILLYLITKKARALFGSYRYVMGTFTMYSLIYAWIEIATQPVMHIVGPVFVVYMDSPMKYETWIGNDVTYFYEENSEMVSFIAPMYWSIGENQEKIWKFGEVLSSVGCVMIITLLPFIMMYSPVGLLITLPFFEISVGRAANYVGASLAVYPSLEPLIALFCIKDFRKTVFCCIKEEPAHPSNISMFTRTQVHC
ncbi:hypothetical protein CAEBREN_25001 [Caenorhabditis brenneri]|uniref:Uncharacterized protein n=1 Tax=Caenorhabditis brenneri TaxID=135651 RepID=G0P1Y4_CAEBE|nr:hypothetical protein CAEBREN_25001 [Caenorhabditis brenneri]